MAITGGAIACVLVAALLVVTFSRLGPSGNAATPSAVPLPQPTPSPSRSAEGAPIATPAAALPATYVRYEHRLGFSLDIPSGWPKKEERSNGDTIFREPVRGRIIALQRVDRAAENMRDYWQAGNSAQKSQPGYQLLGIRTARMAGQAGAEWEFTRRHGTGPEAITHRTLGRGIIIDNTAYIVYLSTREPDFAASQPILDRIAGSFKLSR